MQRHCLIISFAFLFIFTSLNGMTAAPTPAQLDQARIAGLAWLMTHQNGDGSWQSANGSNFQPTTAALTALTNAGIRQGYNYAAAVSYVQNTDPPSVDSLARQILALNSADIGIVPQVTQLNQWKNGSYAWGAYKGYGGSLPDTALALNALYQANLLNPTDMLYTMCYGPVLYAQNPDGSFPYVLSGASGAPTQAAGALLPTLYTALTLKYVQSIYSSVTCSRNNVLTTFTFSTAMTNAVNWILTKQSATDGGFGDFGQSTVLETALAYQTLYRISPTTYTTQLGNASGYLIAQQGAAGNWGGDPLAAAFALQTLPTLAPGALVDTNKNGVPDVVESYLGLNPATPNRTIAAGNGQGITGLTVSQALAVGTQYQPFSYTLTTSGGTTPYIWTIASGLLPDGLNLNPATGAITGTPLTAGTFNFNYSVTDATGANSAVAAQIAITAANTIDNDIPFLPPWGIALLAVLLMSSMVITLKNNGHRFY